MRATPTRTNENASFALMADQFGEMLLRTSTSSSHARRPKAPTRMTRASGCQTGGAPPRRVEAHDRGFILQTTITGRQRARAWVKALPGEAAEDRERIAGHDLPDELARRLDLAVQPYGELLCLLACRRPEEHEAPEAADVVALLLELLLETLRLLARVALDSDLPGRDPALEQLLLDVGARRLRVPAILV